MALFPHRASRTPKPQVLPHCTELGVERTTGGGPVRIAMGIRSHRCRARGFSGTGHPDQQMSRAAHTVRSCCIDLVARPGCCHRAGWLSRAAEGVSRSGTGRPMSTSRAVWELRPRDPRFRAARTGSLMAREVVRTWPANGASVGGASCTRSSVGHPPAVKAGFVLGS